MLKPKPCPDCGNAPVFHGFERNEFYLDLFFWPFIFVCRSTWNFLEYLIRPSFWNKTASYIYKGLAGISIGEIIKEPDGQTGHRALVIWEEAKKRGINMWEFRLFGKSGEFFIAEYEGNVISFENLPRPGRSEPSSLQWVDNKKVLREIFERAGIPIARGGSAWFFSTAKKIFLRTNGTVIVKPHHGSRSRHTTTHVRDIPELYKAFKKAKALSPIVLVEEELKGIVHRITLVGGKVVGVLRREPPSVTADGIHSIKELIEIENKNPLRHGDIFHELVVDDFAKEELARQGVALPGIPKKDVLVFLHQKASRGIGGGATDMTDIAHPDNIALFEKVAEVLEDPLVGIDYITTDMTKSWKETEGVGVIECNSMPFIDIHHYPFVGKARDVAGALWDIVMPETKSKVIGASNMEAPISVRI